MSDEALPRSEFVLYQTEDGRTRIQCRFENESIWLSQALIAELFQKDVRTVNEHLVNIFDEGELHREATIRKFRIVRQEGARQVAREVDHYNLDANLHQSRTLATLRDTLLPKLLSGELSVAGLESRLAGAVAESATVQARKPVP